MRFGSTLPLTVAWLAAVAPHFARGQTPPASFIYETTNEFFGSGDFDGDGRTDFVIVDKESGKFRLGYQLAAGQVTWVDNRPSGIKNLTGFTVGKLLATNRDALAFTSPNANQITLADVSSPTAAIKPVNVPFTAALGPSMIAAVTAGGTVGTGRADLYVASIFNSPEANQATLLRNDGAEFPSLAEATLSGPAVRGNRLALKSGQPEALCELVRGEKGDELRVEEFSSGKPVSVATASGLPVDSDYAAGNFGGSPLVEFI